jgi:dsDNA-specific endonuclease/ATPase MutS2
MSFILIILSFNEWQYLNTIPAVKNFRDEHVQLGGAGITVVEME